MDTITVQNWQTEVSESFGAFSLSVLAGIHAVTDRIKNLILTIMATKFRINSNQPNGNAIYLAYGDFIDTTNDVKLGASFYVTVDETQFDTPVDEKAFVVSGILAEASARSYTGFTASDIQDTSVAPTSAQPAISDCPADATTNYNTITTLLGSLTGAVNTANTKQNQIATQLNTLLAELRNANIIAS